jgi:pimeloyl-ACP methyl ester carboxylesterase
MPKINELYYYLYEGSEMGQKPPIVLIHGAGGNHLFWSPQLRRLTNQRVYTPDLLGHGKSIGVVPQSIADFCESITQWLEALGIFRAVMIGHSMGGAIAISMALDHPENVLGLGLIGSGARLRVNPDILERINNPSTLISTIGKVIDWSFSESTPERLKELAFERMSQVRPSVLYADFLACKKFDELERIEHVTQPTMIICGSDDHMTPLRYSQLLHDRIPNSRLEVIPDAGHMVMLEKPDEVAKALHGFIDSISY